MNVSAVNFTGKTKQGNEYDKTNAGKTVGALVATGIIARDMVILSGKNGNRKFLKQVAEAIAKIPTENQLDFKKFVKKNFKGFKIGTIALGAALIAGIGLGVGAIIDACVNKARAKKADKA